MQLKSLLTSMRRHGGRADCLHCWLCMPQGNLLDGSKLRHPSTREVETYKQLQLLQGLGMMPEFQCEVKLLVGQYGAVDIWVLEWGLAIMVDGQHHFPGAAGQHHSNAYEEQKQIDDRFNEAVLAGAGMPWMHGVLRLHWRHVGDCCVFVMDAAFLAHKCKQQGKKFVKLSWGTAPHTRM